MGFWSLASGIREWIEGKWNAQAHWIGEMCAGTFISTAIERGIVASKRRNVSQPCSDITPDHYMWGTVLSR